MDRWKSFFANAEAWFIDNDLHIYLGALTLIAVSVLGWMLYTEAEKNNVLRGQNVELASQVVDKERRIVLLQSELDLSKVVVIDAKPIQETVEKGSNKLNAKIEKVQNTLINATGSYKVINKTEVIEKSNPVDSELKNMMRQSFCNSNPEDKSCTKVIKK